MDRQLLRRAWDALDSFKQAYPENWHEEDEQVMKDLMAADVEFTQRHDPWKNVALRLGEELSSVGPDGYYDMHPGVWLNWAMAQQPRGKTSLAQPKQELTTTLKASIHAGLDKKNDNKTQVDHHGKQPEQEPKKIPESWATHGGLWIEALHKHQRGES